MAYDIGARIGIEGEKDYKRAINEITSSQKVLRSEMGLLAAQFEGQEDSVEALTKRHELLERTLYTQQDKVDALRAALQNAATSFGEADHRTMQWQEKLNNAEAELARTNNQLKKTSEALENTNNAIERNEDSVGNLTEGLENSKSGTIGLGDALDRIGGKLGISLPGEMTNTLNGLGKINTKTLAVAGGMAALAAAIVGVEKKLISMTKEAASAADEILTLSTISGISTQTLQEYQYASELIDVSVDTIVDSQTKLIRSMSDAQSGTEAQIVAFNRLGVAWQNTDGTLRNAQDVYWDTIDALGHISNETQRDAIAMELLGRSARDLNPIIKAGSERMNELAKEAHDAGYILGTEDLDALGKVDDAMQRLDKTTEAAKNQIAVQFAPAVTEATEDTTTFIAGLGKSFKDSGVVKSFGDILTSASGLLEPSEELIEWALPGLAKGFDTLAYSTAIVADTLSAIVGLFKGLTGGGWDTFATAMGWNTSKGQLSAQGRLYYKDALNSTEYNESLGGWSGNADLTSQNMATGVLTDNNKNVKTLIWDNGKWITGNATGNYNWRGGVTWVGENGPEKVFLPQGSRIMNAQESRSDGDTIVYVTIDAKNIREFNDIVKIAQEARMKARKA